MPITVHCSGCGKALKVKDELAGKRVKCPGCGATFTAAAGPTVFNAQAAEQAASKRSSGGGKVSISWGPIVLVACVLLVVAGIVAFIMGPKKVWNEWEEIGGDAENAVLSVISRGLQDCLSDMGGFDPTKAHQMPEAKEVMFYRPGFTMSMPETVDFQGVSSDGEFRGKYHTKTGEVEADVELRSLGFKKGAPIPKVHVTGRIKNSVVEAKVGTVTRG